MTKTAVEYLTGILGLIILISVCAVIIIVATRLEARLKNKNKNIENQNSEAPEFVVGRIYQMEDGSFAKYVGDGKFKKVIEMD